MGIRNPYFPALPNTWQQGQVFAATTTSWSNDAQYWNFQNNTNLTFQWSGIGQVSIKGTTSSVQFMVINNYSGVNHFIQLGVVPSASNPTIASGTIYQNTTASYQRLIVPCYASTAGTAGTAAVALGTSSTPGTIATEYISGSTSSTAQKVLESCATIPPGWYYSITLSGASFGTITQIQM